MVLDTDAGAEDLVPLKISLRRSGRCTSLIVGEYPLRVTKHTIARILQRTANVADIKSTGPMLLHHLAQAHKLVEADALRRGDRVQTS